MGSLARLVSLVLMGSGVAAGLACNAISGADALVAGDENAAGLDGTSSSSSGGSSTSGTASSSSSSSSSGGSSSGGSSSTSSSSGGSSSGASASSGSSSSSSSSSGSASSSGGTSTSSTSSSSGTTTPPTEYGSSFATAAECTALTGTNGATVVWEGSGACMVCASAAGEAFMQAKLTSSKSGKLRAQALARWQLGRTSPDSATMKTTVGGASITGSAGLGADYVQLGGGASYVSVQEAAPLTISVGILNAAAGDCIVIDDLRVTID